MAVYDHRRDRLWNAVDRVSGKYFEKQEYSINTRRLHFFEEIFGKLLEIQYLFQGFMLNN